MIAHGSDDYLFLRLLLELDRRVSVSVVHSVLVVSILVSITVVIVCEAVFVVIYKRRAQWNFHLIPTVGFKVLQRT